MSRQIALKAVKSRIENRLKRIRKKKREELLELVAQYHTAKSNLYGSYDKLTIIAMEIRTTTLQSFLRYGDRNKLNSCIILHYIRKQGTPLDIQAMDISEQYHIPVSEDDLVEFILDHPSGRSGFHKYQELEIIKEAIKQITRFNATKDLLALIKENFSPAQAEIKVPF